MNRIRIFLIFSVLTACGAIGQQLPPKSVKTTTMKPQKFVEAPKKIFIRTFKVYYQMIAEAEKTVHGGRQFGGGAYKGNATARLAVGVEGLAPEDLQDLTNQIYQEYTAELKDLGLEVMTAKDIPDIEYFEGWGMIEGPHINQEQIEGSLMVVPEGFAYRVKKITKKGKEKTGGFLAGITNVNGNQAADFASSAYGTIPKISKALDNAIVAEIAINVPSIYLNPKSVLGSAKVKGGPYLRIGQAKVSYVSGRAKTAGVASPNALIEMALKEAVPINGVFESEEFKVVATKSKTTVPSYAAFFTVENKSVELTNTIDCDAQTFKTEVKKPIVALLDLSVEKLGQGLQGVKVK